MGRRRDATRFQDFLKCSRRACLPVGRVLDAFFPTEEAKQGCSGISYVLEAALQVAERFLFPPKAKIRLIRVFSFKYLATPQTWCRAKLSISSTCHPSNSRWSKTCLSADRPGGGSSVERAEYPVSSHTAGVVSAKASISSTTPY